MAEAALCAHELTVWAQVLLFDGEHRVCEPKRLRYRLLHVAGRLTRHARRLTLHLPADWPWAAAIAKALNASPRCPPDHPALSTTPPSTPARAGTTRRAAPHREPAIAGAGHPGQRSPRPANHAHSPKTRRHRPAHPLEGLAGESRLGGATPNPNGRWVTQQARNLSLTGALSDVRFLIRDRDSKFVAAFDEVFRTEGVEVILTLFRSPQANAYAERFVRTARAECLDWPLILGPRHLVRVLRVYVDHYNTQRPHRALGRHPPVAIRPSAPPPPMAAIQRRDHLGGLLHEYHTAAA